MNLNNIKKTLIAGIFVVAASVAMPRANALETSGVPVPSPQQQFVILPLPPCLLVISLVIQQVVWVLEGQKP